MRFIFKTKTTMKPHNSEKWWVDSDVVREVTVDADSLKEALESYREIVEERDFIEISKNAIKSRSPMYVDDKNGSPKQIGYVITGRMDFDRGDYTGYSKQYVDLWVRVLTVVETDFDDE